MNSEHQHQIYGFIEIQFFIFGLHLICHSQHFSHRFELWFNLFSLRLGVPVLCCVLCVRERLNLFKLRMMFVYFHYFFAPTQICILCTLRTKGERDSKQPLYMKMNSLRRQMNANEHGSVGSVGIEMRENTCTHSQIQQHPTITLSQIFIFLGWNFKLPICFSSTNSHTEGTEDTEWHQYFLRSRCEFMFNL